jgi:hypothetical protein
MFLDGETEVTVGTAEEVSPGGSPAFDADLETPHRAVVVWTVEDERILEVPVPSTQTRVRVWVNHSVEPDKVIVGLG